MWVCNKSLRGSFCFTGEELAQLCAAAVVGHGVVLGEQFEFASHHLLLAEHSSLWNGAWRAGSRLLVSPVKISAAERHSGAGVLVVATPCGQTKFHVCRHPGAMAQVSVP